MELIFPQRSRARIAALHHLRAEFNEDLKTATAARRKELEQQIALVRNGVFPEEFDAGEMVKLVEKKQSFSNEPLSTTELMTFNTYFDINPGKICGQEVIASSRDFPVSIAGNREDVEKAIDRTLETKNSMELEAQALELELNLFEL
ncbi:MULTISPECIES: hypothetical protein [Croceimicrobium]|uniref:Uncharacterized protein n=1 Tax=Croceimicrobium hydrocarbonivorans TaxID=2761580 RepID=A0A7H0VBT6_9FLAO|nr:hypothetical protein [Croceimicrobium hydrocarbonivorans]QNR23184.1 hypothetical protein H4K34_12460 [Croceimicrobium hydrocarbonivorans]